MNPGVPSMPDEHVQLYHGDSLAELAQSTDPVEVTRNVAPREASLERSRVGHPRPVHMGGTVPGPPGESGRVVWVPLWTLDTEQLSGCSAKGARPPDAGLSWCPYLEGRHGGAHAAAPGHVGLPLWGDLPQGPGRSARRWPQWGDREQEGKGGPLGPQMAAQLRRGCYRIVKGLGSVL